MIWGGTGCLCLMFSCKGFNGFVLLGNIWRKDKHYQFSMFIAALTSRIIGNAKCSILFRNATGSQSNTKTADPIDSYSSSNLRFEYRNRS